MQKKLNSINNKQRYNCAYSNKTENNALCTSAAR